MIRKYLISLNVDEQTSRMLREFTDKFALRPKSAIHATIYGFYSDDSLEETMVEAFDFQKIDSSDISRLECLDNHVALILANPLIKELHKAVMEKYIGFIYTQQGERLEPYSEEYNKRYPFTGENFTAHMALGESVMIPSMKQYCFENLLCKKAYFESLTLSRKEDGWKVMRMT